MSKCIRCHSDEGEYIYSEGGYVCDHCIGKLFSCPDCGRVFPLENGDAGNGFCYDCASEH